VVRSLYKPLRFQWKDQAKYLKRRITQNYHDLCFFIFIFDLLIRIIFVKEIRISLPQMEDNRDPPLFRVESLKDISLIF